MATQRRDIGAGLRNRLRELRLGASQGGAFLRAMGEEWLRPPPSPQIDGLLRVDGVRGPIEILRDSAAVPHIYAGSEADALFGLGFVHLQDRYWQMEFYRRVGRGRMAEVGGPPGLPADRLMRHVGLARSADASWEAASADVKARLIPYIDGVNAAMRVTPLPLEVRILDYEPEPWQPSDSALWAKLVAFMLSPAWEAQILRARIIEQAGVEALAALDPGYPTAGPSIVPPGAPYGALSRALTEEFARVAEQTGLGGPGFGSPGWGSNAWAVSPEATANGVALFACDPHLSATNPPYGHFAHLECPEFSVAGATLPGFPGIIWGLNRRIAWGPTAGLASTQDVVIEEFDGEDRYRTADGWETAGTIEERVAVRGHPDELLRIRTTRHGPIVSPEIPGSRHALALHSTVLEEATSGQALLELPRAGNVDEFRAAVSHFHEFNLVFAYADVDGHTGVQMAGAVPRRKPGSGWLPPCGWDPSTAWQGELPKDELPHVFDPPGGRVWTANNGPAPVDGLPFEGEFLDSFRAARIGEVLNASDAHTTEDMARLQMDRTSHAFEAVARHLAEVEALGAREGLLLQRVRRWDGRAETGSVAAAIVGATYTRLLDAVVRAKLGRHSAAFFDDVHAVPNLNLVGARAASLVVGLLDEAPDDWFGPAAEGVAGREIWSAVLLRAFRDGVALLEERFGPDESRWTWGRVRRVTLKHGLSDVPALARVFDLGPFPIGSDSQAPLQAGPMTHDPFAPITAIPALRMVVEMSNPPRAEFTLAGGQVGRRGDPHATDLLQDWRRGRLRPLEMERAAIEADSARRLYLEPTPPDVAGAD